MFSSLPKSFVTAALLLLASSPALAAKDAGKPAAAPREPVVAVFPFKVLNPGEQYAHYGEGASDSIINRVVNDRSLKIVEESQLDKALKSLERSQSGLMEEDGLLAIGKMVDAQFIVVGSVQLVADQVSVTGRVLDTESREIISSVRAQGATAGVFSVYEEVAVGLVKQLTSHLARRAIGDTDATIAVRALIGEGKQADPQFGGGDLRAAVMAYNKAVMRDPVSPRARLALGDAQFRLGEFMAARDNLLQATALDEQNPFAWTLLGRCEGALKNHPAARLAFEKALAVDSTFLGARFGLAVALFNAGELKDARTHAAIAANAGDTRAKDLLQHIDQALKSSAPH